MSGEQSEEKSLPASKHKLDKERKKGRIATSPDLYSGAATICGLLVLAGLMTRNVTTVDDLAMAVSEATKLSWPGSIELAVPAFTEALVTLVAPLLVAATLSVVLSNILYHGGIVFSVDPLSPKMSRLSPTAGFKRIFGRRGLVTGAQKLVRLALWIAATVAMVFAYVPELIGLPACELGCILSVGLALAQTYTIVAVLLLVTFSIADMIIQKQLFLHEMRMTKSEAKREGKDLYGSPDIKRERDRLYHDDAPSRAAAKPAPGQATGVVVGQGRLSLFRYIQGDGIAPIILKSVSGNDAADVIKAIAGVNMVKILDADLAERLKDITDGTPIPDSLFDEFARAFVRSGGYKDVVE